MSPPLKGGKDESPLVLGAAEITSRVCRLSGFYCLLSFNLSGVKRRKRNPTIIVLQRIARALGADIEDMVKWRS